MIDVDISMQTEPEAWNRRVGQVVTGGFRQTTWYGDFKAQWREQALYFTARDDRGRIVGQLLGIFGSPWGWGLERRPLAAVTQPLARWLAPHFYWQEGPLALVEDGAEKVRAALLRAVAEEAARRGCRQVLGQASHFGPNIDEPGSVARVAEDLGWAVEEKATLMVDLELAEEELWYNVRKEARTKVRKAAKQGIKILPLDDDRERLQQAYGIVVETAVRNGVAPLSQDDFLLSHRYHSEIGVERSFISLHQGTPLSYQKLICYNGNALLGGVAYSDYSRNQRLYGNDLMQWHLIKQGKDAGWRRLDFGGAEPDATDPKMQGIYRFKAKWGGQLFTVDRMRLTLGMAGRLQRILPKKLHQLVHGGSA